MIIHLFHSECMDEDIIWNFISLFEHIPDDAPLSTSPNEYVAGSLSS